MKPHLDISHEGTLSDEGRVRMTFDENSIAHLMGVLTDLYSDKELAVIREYSTNAFDSHVEAGNKAPIQISLPSDLNPIFVVKDFGVGMSVDDVCNKFSKYGWSSKRETNEAVGMLGLGCKSALTYTSQFTIVAIQNGVKATVLVTREDDGTGAVQVIDTSSTTEPNGVEVRIPVKNPTSFNNRAERFYRFWQKGTVLVNDVEPKHFSSSSDIVIDDNIVLTSSVDRDYIVMGNVAYPVTKSGYPTYSGQSRLVDSQSMFAVITVPIGEVNFTPSREELQYTKRTEETIQRYQQQIKDSLLKRIQEEMDACTTHAEALATAIRLRKAFWNNIPSFTFKGEKIPVTFFLRFPRPDYDPLDKNCKVEAEYRCLQWNLSHAVDWISSRCTHLSADDATKRVYLTGYRRTGLDHATKKRLKQWAQEKNLTNKTVITVPEPFGMPWLADATWLKFEDLNQIKLPKPEGQVRVAGKVKIIEHNRGYMIDVDDVPAHTGFTTYMTAQQRKDYANNGRSLTPLSDLAIWLAKTDSQCVVLGLNQINRFKRDFPAAQPFQEVLADEIKKLAASMTPEEIFMIESIYAYENTGANRLVASKILDPEFRSILERINLAKTTANNTAWDKMRSLCSRMGVEVPSLSKASSSGLMAELLEQMKNYPLLKEFRFTTVKHSQITEYVNALFLMRNAVMLVPSR